MVGDQESLTKDGLTFSMGNAGEQIRVGIVDQLFHGLQIISKRFDAGVPRLGVRRGVAFGPIAFGKLRRNMAGISAELQNIPLG